MWPEVLSELDTWHRARRTALFWLRDDDAVDASRNLRALLDLAAAHEVPVALSVIPTRFTARLVRQVRSHPATRVLVHGHSHVNHAPDGMAKSEFGGRRPLHVMEGELVDGLERIRRGFGAQALPVLVPPWNRIAPRLVRRLPLLGYRGISSWKPRLPHEDLGPLVRVNTHLDPIAWRLGRTPKSEGAVAAALLRKLRWRRARPDRAHEPLGLLTHHLLWGPEIENVVANVLKHTRSHPAVRWLPAGSVFGA